MTSSIELDQHQFFDPRPIFEPSDTNSWSQLRPVSAPFLRLEWWGARANSLRQADQTRNVHAIKAAFQVAYDLGVPIHLMPAAYYFNDSLAFQCPPHGEGEERPMPSIIGAGGVTGNSLILGEQVESIRCSALIYTGSPVPGSPTPFLEFKGMGRDVLGFAGGTIENVLIMCQGRRRCNIGLRTERVHHLRLNNVAILGFDIGWQHKTGLYASCVNPTIQECNVGIHLQQEANSALIIGGVIRAGMPQKTPLFGVLQTSASLPEKVLGELVREWHATALTGSSNADQFRKNHPTLSVVPASKDVLSRALEESVPGLCHLRQVGIGVKVNSAVGLTIQDTCLEANDFGVILYGTGGDTNPPDRELGGVRVQNCYFEANLAMLLVNYDELLARASKRPVIGISFENNHYAGYPSEWDEALRAFPDLTTICIRHAEGIRIVHPGNSRVVGRARFDHRSCKVISRWPE